ncbi:MAG TPA: murein L,D-transpeptidase catalytic domain family protein [Longimicrobiales bacterium]|nr:murein L,D-transpeptidase catalytic domain family protein [Longimicrobiales bacterium]
MHPVSASRLYAGAILVTITLITAAAGTTRAEAASDGTVSRLVAATPAVVAGTPALATATPAVAAATVREPASTTDAPSSDRADEALRALADRVTRSSHSDALRTAFTAYYNYRSANPDNVTKPYLYYVDMGLDNHTARGYVFDMDQLTVVEGPFTVAHGRGSARTRDGVPTSFSNRPGSNATSLGLYLAQETYNFSGKSGGRRYTSVGLRMRGESGKFNSAARRRGIVAHGAPYVTAGQAGRSEGCPAMEMKRAQRLLPMIANGGVVFIYSPKASDWLNSDPWILAD